MRNLFRLATATTVLLLVLPLSLVAQNSESKPLAPIPASVTFAPANPKLPTYFIVGDSVSNGWGPQAKQFFDPEKINVVVGAASGRSARTIITEGIWDRIRVHIKPHDIVTLEFGHNDASPIVDSSRSRGVIRSIGDETQEIDNPVTHKHETVLTYGGYMRQLIHDVQAAGATPIILSQTARNQWVDGHMVPDNANFSKMAAAIAAQQHLEFLDVNTLTIAEFERLGEDKAKAMFHDAVHMLPENWIYYATWITEGLKGLPEAPLNPYLSPAGKALAPITLK